MARTADLPAKPRRRASRRSTEEVRALILEAASDLFGERGYTQTTMRDIASAADIGLSVLYRHYTSKERLFAASFVAPFLGSFRADRANRSDTEGEVIAEFIRDLHSNLTTHRHAVVTLLAALEDPDAELVDEVRAELGDAWQNLQLGLPAETEGGASSASERVRDANMLVIAMVVGLVVFQPWVAAARNGDDQPLVELAALFSVAGVNAATATTHAGHQQSAVTRS